MLISGCSRTFLLSTLYHCLQDCKRIFALGGSIAFPFSETSVDSWFQSALIDCRQDSIETRNFFLIVGGTQFDEVDSSTYWTHPKHFYTWLVLSLYYSPNIYYSIFKIAFYRWKNNIERKSKFKVIENDSCYCGIETNLKSRAMYCKAVIALSLNIKGHFDR